MNVELIVFDLAGTTVKDDRNVHQVLKNILARHAVTITLDDANVVMGIPKPVAIRKLLEECYDGMQPITYDWIAQIHEEFVKEMIRFYEFDRSVGEKDGVSETFRMLKNNNIKVVVDTGFDRLITTPLLKRLGWVEKQLIDNSVTSDEVVRGRPYPDLIFKAMELTGVYDVRNVVKVGDTISDLQEGTSAGCGAVIGVTSGAFSREALENEKHTHLVEGVPDVLKILNIG